MAAVEQPPTGAPVEETPESTTTAIVAPKQLSPEEIKKMVEPLIKQVQEWSQQLAPLAVQGGTAVQEAVKPVAAALQAWSSEHLEPLVARGGEQVKVACAPAVEALQKLMTQLEPYTTSISTAVQNAVRPALEAIKLLIEKLKPLVLNAAEELKKNSIIAAKATAEWNTTVLQPWAAQTGQAIKVSSAAALENAKVQSIKAAENVAEWNKTQLQPWAAQTGEMIKTKSVETAMNVQQWTETEFKPWVATTAVPTAQKWWQEALICFCVPLAGLVAQAGLKEQAAALKALAPEKDDYPAAVTSAVEAN